MPNRYEEEHGFDPKDPADANLDPDNDGLTNLQEYQNNTVPNNFDTDGDLLPDGWEVRYGLDPNDPTGNNGADGDGDNDGLNNFDEYLHETDPGDPDSDDDNTNDGDEVGNGSDPNNPDDNGDPPPPENSAEVEFTVGDPSGSESERYKYLGKTFPVNLSAISPSFPDM